MTSNPIVCGRRNCASCGRWKLAVDFPWRWRRRRTKGSGGKARSNVPTVGATCATCLRAQARARYAGLPPAARHAVGVRANGNARKRKDKLEETAKRAARALRQGNGELNLVPFRMWMLGKARQEGGASALARQLGMDEHNVRRWLHGYDWDNDDGWGGWAKCEPRPVYTVDVATVDRVGVALGEPDLLERLYPYAEDGTV
jgi:hypothetical protein